MPLGNHADNPKRADRPYMGKAGTIRDTMRWAPDLCQDRLYYIAMHVGETEVASLELEREAGVVDAEDGEDGRMQIMHMHGIARDVVGVVVGLAV